MVTIVRSFVCDVNVEVMAQLRAYVHGESNTFDRPLAPEGAANGRIGLIGPITSGIVRISFRESCARYRSRTFRFSGSGCWR